LILDIESVNASWSKGKLHVALTVRPEGVDHLDLKTGEIFQSQSRAALMRQEDKAISATLFVSGPEQNSDGIELRSEMRYRPPQSESGPEIWLLLRLTSDHLAGFHAMLIAGLMPKQAVVFFPLGEFEYGWEPDGSGQKWDNESKPTVPIEDVRFDLSFIDVSESIKVNLSVIHKLETVESSLREISWFVGLIALLILCLILPRFWR